MYIATIDCGTTNSRVYIVDQNKKIIGKGTKRVGVRDTSMTKSIDTLKNGLIEALHEALKEANLKESQISFAISSGMITSEIGLLDIPHLQTEAGIKELAANLVKVEDKKIFPASFPIYFIPGIRNRFDKEDTFPTNVGELDFMRGEETQMIGYLDLHQVSHPLIVVILSSHTKFIQIGGDGKIKGSLTSLSGQVFEAIKKETFIGKSIDSIGNEIKPHSYFDSSVVENAFKWQQKSGFVRSLLMIRFLDVLLDTTWYERNLFFEGLIASEDLKAFKDFYSEVNYQNEIVFIGPKQRTDIYEYLFKEKLNWGSNSIKTINDTSLIDKLNIYGSIAIAKKANLI
ncbi:MAG: 2-dehydro-3-deoxygalactonokinase [Bacteroidia bacterium]|nr:2-dehydro-3-deoxygalactonokinase [Bacteroidia bacterium]